MFVENDWSDKSSDAFWEMVNDQLLFAKVTILAKLMPTFERSLEG